MEIEIINFLYITIYAVMSTFLIEGINYFFIYRKSDYTSIEDSIKMVNKKINRNKVEVLGMLSKKNYEKKTSNLNSLLQTYTQDLTKLKFKFNILTGFLMVFLINYASNIFNKIVVCKLPFLPWGIFTSMTHRTIEGDNYYECGYFFIIIIVGIILRENIQVFLGLNKNNGLYDMLMTQNQNLYNKL